jgi:hypothetical protein
MKSNHKLLVCLIIILGFALRLYVYLNTAVINPDGAIYIDQARIIYYHLWNILRSHADPVLTPTPLLIAGLYAITGNWVFSACAVSLFFGTALLIPVYLLSGRYFEKDYACLITLIFAVIPTLVFNSIEIIRDPLAWFFLTFGLFFFPASLFASGIFFLIAILSRVECIIFPVLSSVYLLMDRQGKPVRRLFIFLSPLIIAASISLGAYMFRAPDMLQDRFAKVGTELTQSVDHYRMIRLTLKDMVHHPPHGIPGSFFEKTRSLVWFLPLGVILRNALEAFHYFFFVLLLIGLSGMRERRVMPTPQYFALLATGMVLLFYIHILTNWQMEQRWVVLIMLPSFVFLGMGLERVVSWLVHHIGISPSTMFVILVLVILAFCLPKDLIPREQDKIVFKNIGEAIAAMENQNGEIETLTLGDSNRWISFYANLHVEGAPYPDKYSDFESFIGQSYNDFLKNIRDRKIKYVIWEEKQWPLGHFDFLAAVRPENLQRLGQWSHPDTGRIILFKVLPPSAPMEKSG